MARNAEKAKYGWYVGKIILFIGFIGVTGLLLFILGFFFNTPLNVAFWIAGLALTLLFLWPTIGFITMNLWIPRQSAEFGFLNDFKAPKVLDCGCGTGRHALQMAKQLPKGGFLTGIDIYDPIAVSGNSLEKVQRNADLEGVAAITAFQRGSIIEIPFDDQSYDIVRVGSVFHELHAKDDKKRAFTEVRRVLKDDGLLLMGEWDRNSWQLILFAGIFAFVFKPKEYWKQELEKNRFKVINTNNTFGFVDFFAKKHS
jgi:ubiquinone/menaquinone biosynthesis C-methylase UbiE